MPTISLNVNGEARSVDVPTTTLLVELIRGPLGLSGTHVGCDTGQCGACTVLLDGRAVKSCSVLAVQAAGHDVTTVEGLARDGALHPLQQAFVDHHGLQCGFCTPGMLMTAACLLRDNPRPDDAAIAGALEGNLCRCTGYVNIVASVRAAAERLATEKHA